MDILTDDCELPDGWLMRKKTRSGGCSAGKVDVYYISPNPEKRIFRSKVRLIEFFGSTYDLTGFIFSKGIFDKTQIAETTDGSSDTRKEERRKTHKPHLVKSATAIGADEPILDPRTAAPAILSKDHTECNFLVKRRPGRPKTVKAVTKHAVDAVVTHVEPKPKPKDMDTNLPTFTVPIPPSRINSLINRSRRPVSKPVYSPNIYVTSPPLGRANKRSADGESPKRAPGRPRKSLDFSKSSTPKNRLSKDVVGNQKILTIKQLGDAHKKSSRASNPFHTPTKKRRSCFRTAQSTNFDRTNSVGAEADKPSTSVVSKIWTPDLSEEVSEPASTLNDAEFKPAVADLLQLPVTLSSNCPTTVQPSTVAESPFGTGLDQERRRKFVRQLPNTDQPNPTEHCSEPKRIRRSVETSTAGEDHPSKAILPNCSVSDIKPTEARDEMKLEMREKFDGTEVDDRSLLQNEEAEHDEASSVYELPWNRIPQHAGELIEQIFKGAKIRDDPQVRKLILQRHAVVLNNILESCKRTLAEERKSGTQQTTCITEEQMATILRKSRKNILNIIKPADYKPVYCRRRRRSKAVDLDD